MRSQLPREQTRRLTLVGLLTALAFLVQGPALTGATFTDSATVGSSAFTTGSWCGTNVYPATVLATAGGPRNYLQLDETGLVAFVADSAPGAPTGLSQGTGHVWGSPGLLDCGPGTSLGLAGTGAPLARTGGATVAGPATLTTTAWVDIQGSQGRLLGFSRNNNNNTSDRVLYVDGAGYLRFGISKNWGGAPANGYYSIRSNNPIVGARHHIAATLGPAGMRLFVDGVLQAQTNSAITQGRTGYTGRWRVGYDLLTAAWPGVTVASQVPVGTIDEVAVWHSQLTPGQVAALAAANHD